MIVTSLALSWQQKTLYIERTVSEEADAIKIAHD